MAELLSGMKRTHMCTALTKEDVGSEVTVMGWCGRRRDLGGLIFVFLRDRSGIVQVVFDNAEHADIFEKASTIRNEFVLGVKGTVRLRTPENINPKLKTGEIEVVASELKIFAEAETPPFIIEDDLNVNEALKLKYRYLDLRRPTLQNTMRIRSEICRAARNYLSENGFMEIETPYLGKSTPEGARDYLVPSRVHPGEFYALPQSPQLFKQLLMIAGFDRYYQIARCFRDEDLRANRQPEFTQIDMEMSFVGSTEDVMCVMEGLVSRIFKDAGNVTLQHPFRRMTYQEAMDRFGSDKPDTRFGLELVDVSDLSKLIDFQVFTGTVAAGGSVRLINAKGLSSKLSRRDIDALGEFVKTYQAKGLAWINFAEDGTMKSSFAKFLNDEYVTALKKRANAETGDVLLFVADKDSVVYAALGALRLHIAEKMNLIDKSVYDVLWVTEFPLFEYSEEEGRYVAMHHPFTSPMDEDLPYLESDPGRVRAKAYDLVINGQEAGGGSIRIHSNEIQKRMFNQLGFTDEQIEENFGYFVNAFKYGAPPHGGLAFGLDRLVMLLTGAESIKDVIAFPKVQNASCLMSEAPTPVSDKQLKELSIAISGEKND